MRYIVEKTSGSGWARVIDTTTGKRVRSFNIFKGIGKNNGWARAEQMRDKLNATATEK